MAEYLTHLFEEYREHARHLRNTAFDTRASQDWGVVEDFEAVSTVLFERLVLYRLPEGHYQQAKNWKDTSYFLIEPADGGFPAMISRDKGASGYWDHPIKMLLKGEAVIAFHEYFDWDQHARIDLRYYYGVILESSRYPDLAGHHILIETDMAWIASNPSKVEEAG
ncbi:hypothetical protein [Haloferula sp. BvORR071]|uniref:hypothetical protein n=1 Tax=Haloferula sp. BvORR071 TaxID=1396141 RepID=UPI00055014B2|nr:hypothetical protein [Haloferula sp. BvORR071]